MEEIRRTTWDEQNPVNNEINYLSTGAGFLPSTVVSVIFAYCRRSDRNIAVPSPYLVLPRSPIVVDPRLDY